MGISINSKSRKRSLLVVFSAFLLVAAIVVLAVTDLQGYIIDIAGEEVFIGIFVFLCVLPGLVTLIIVIRSFTMRKPQINNIASTGEDGTADIKSISLTGSKIKVGGVEKQGVILELEILSKSGQRYALKIQYFIPIRLVPQYKPGVNIPVKINRENRDEIIITGLD